VDIAADDRADVVHGEHVVRGCNGYDRRPVLPADGQGVVAARQLLG
jgi:hypothetical protein